MTSLLSGLATNLHPSESLLTLLGATVVAIVHSMEQSIRTIGCGDWVGWGLLLGNCLCALILGPVAAIHAAIALGIA